MLKVSFQLQDISLALGGAVAGLGPRTTAGYWVMRKRFALNIRIFWSFWSLSPSSKLEHQEFDKRPRNWTNLMVGDLSSPKLLPLVHASFKLIATSLAVHAVQSSSTILNHKDDGTRKWSAEKGQVFHSVLMCAGWVQVDVVVYQNHLIQTHITYHQRKICCLFG